MSHVSDLPVKKRRVSEGFKPHYGADMRQLRGSDVWWVPWELLPAFLTVVGGTLETILVSQSVSIQRIVPLRFADDERLIANDVDCEYRGLNPATGTWLGADVTIQYATPDYSLTGSEAFIKITGAQSSRSITFPASGGLIGGEKPVIDPTKPIPGTTYSYTLYNVPFLSDALYQSLQKTVNEAPFRGIAPGYVLYNGASFESKSVFGTAVFTWDITHQFEVSSVPWNFEAKRNGDLADMTLNGADFFPPADHSLLFYA